MAGFGNKFGGAGAGNAAPAQPAAAANFAGAGMLESLLAASASAEVKGSGRPPDGDYVLQLAGPPRPCQGNPKFGASNGVAFPLVVLDYKGEGRPSEQFDLAIFKLGPNETGSRTLKQITCAVYGMDQKNVDPAEYEACFRDMFADGQFEYPESDEGRTFAVNIKTHQNQTNEFTHLRYTNFTGFTLEQVKAAKA